MTCEAPKPPGPVQARKVNALGAHVVGLFAVVTYDEGECQPVRLEGELAALRSERKGVKAPGEAEQHTYPAGSLMQTSNRLPPDRGGDAWG